MVAQSPNEHAAGLTVGPARPGDHGAVATLLRAEGLPLDGVEQCMRHGVVARAGVQVVGFAALEPHGAFGLLRSVAVAPHWRRRGVAGRLCTACEARARGLGLERLYLLTETAPRFFEALGYQALSRAQAPEPIQRSREFAHICAHSAQFMARTLT